MGQPRQTTAEVHANLCELLDWQFAERILTSILSGTPGLAGASIPNPGRPPS